MEKNSIWFSIFASQKQTYKQNQLVRPCLEQNSNQYLARSLKWNGIPLTDSDIEGLSGGGVR